MAFWFKVYGIGIPSCATQVIKVIKNIKVYVPRSSRGGGGGGLIKKLFN
jgi:copper chaperone CopZ